MICYYIYDSKYRFLNYHIAVRFSHITFRLKLVAKFKRLKQLFLVMNSTVRTLIYIIKGETKIAFHKTHSAGGGHN
jgi:hypothetical protein